MGAADILERIALAGVRLTALDAKRLWAEPAKTLTDELRSLIRENKSELVALLHRDHRGHRTPMTPMPPMPSVTTGEFEGPANEPTLPAPAETDAYARIARMIRRLADDPGLRYAVDTHAGIDPEDVILSLAIRGKGACEIRIPKSRYDAFALLDVIERHTNRETVQ